MHTSEKHPHPKSPRIYIKFQFKEQEQLFPALHLPLWLPRGSYFCLVGHPPSIHCQAAHTSPQPSQTAWNRLHTRVLLLCFTPVAFPADCAWGRCPSFILDPWKYLLHCTALWLPRHCTLISIIFRDKGHKVGSWTTEIPNNERGCWCRMVQGDLESENTFWQNSGNEPCHTILSFPKCRLSTLFSTLILRAALPQPYWNLIIYANNYIKESEFFCLHSQDRKIPFCRGTGTPWGITSTCTHSRMCQVKEQSMNLSPPCSHLHLCICWKTYGNSLDSQCSQQANIRIQAAHKVGISIISCWSSTPHPAPQATASSARSGVSFAQYSL